ALLVLDNCEHVASACAALVDQALRACPGLRVLATGRQPLGITGERVWRLRPLAVPGPADVDLASIAANDAVRLFVDRARDTDRGFALTLDRAPAVAEICRRLDGLPLALELAAARTAALSPAEIAARLDQSCDLPRRGAGPGEGRHASLASSFEWSHQVLGADEAVVLRRLSVFSGGWTLAAAEEVCSGDGVRREQVLDLLGGLVAASLVMADHGGGATRYRLLGTTRRFARARLDAAGEAEALLSRHAAWCLALAAEAEAGREGPAQQAWLRRLDEDHDNLRAALAWARDGGRVETALRLANSLTWFWETRNHLREGLAWLDGSVSADGRAPAAVRAEAMRAAGRFVHLLGDHRSGLELVGRGVRLLRQSGEVEEASGCVCHDVLEMCRNPLHSVPLMEQQVARTREAGDPGRLAHALCNLGQARFLRGDGGGARTCFGEVLGLRPAGIGVDAVAVALLGLARVALLRGEYDAAEAPLREVLDHAERIGNADARSGALALLGELARARGDTTSARVVLADALELAHESGIPLSIGRSELFLAGVEHAEGRMEPAGVLYARALARVETGVPFPYHQVRCTLGLAAVAAATGDARSAAALYAEAHERALATGDAQGVARALAGQGGLARAGGDPEAAVRRHHQALDLEEQVGDLPAVARSLEALAALAGVGGEPDRMARLLGAASAIRERHGFARPAPEQRSLDADVALVRHAVGDGAWESARRQGSRLSLQQAVSYARKGRGGRRRRATEGLESLTRAELEVVALVVQGLTNVEVGERLFISRRTVQSHLSHVYHKLGIACRRDLAREAAGWPPVLLGA
ncbi:MAG TPA: LuxR C-terminal-related transcriptional regulator, partial [Acidimicrobiales bacterium]|nr:LuxR C-terminal-related transcriptional regulator [Acidimicrobiales bacterium]